MASILLLEERPAIRKGLRIDLGLQTGLQVVGEAGSVPEALHLLGACPTATAVDIVIMGLDLPTGAGIQAVQSLRSAHPACAIVILTMGDDVELRARALAAGADAFVLKGDPEELHAALRRLVCARGPVFEA